ncbi:MAG: hypothetical protein HXS43_12055 [Theionarchaea archaeon]|nr:hypothetical protein [Theionarchaea archaeon]
MIMVSLQESAPDITLVGGKAFNLMKLQDVHVPNGVCLTTEAYDLYCRHNNLGDQLNSIAANADYDNPPHLKESAQKIRTLIMEGDMPEEITVLLDTVPYRNLVVRSSATLEDLPHASFAGQQETIFNPRTLEQGVKQCWASLWNERALVYRRSRAVGALPKMAVIIQEAVPCDVSGLVFTRNPLTSGEEIVVEAIHGLGEPLVAGEITPDRYVLDRTLKITSQDLSDQNHQSVLAPSGTQSVPCGSTPCLDDAVLNRLCRVCLDIEAQFGEPQDVEFGIYSGQIHIFQARPITTRKEDVWTRGYSDDYWTGVTSPLYFSLLGEFLDVYVNQEGNRIMGYTELEGVPLLRYHKAHAYFNTTVLREVFKYNPQWSRVKELLDYFPEHERQTMKELPFNLWKRVLAELRIALLDWDGTLFNTYKKYNEFSEKYLKNLTEFDSLTLEALTDQELLDQFWHLYTLCLKHYRLVRWGIATHNMGMNMILKRFLMSWYRGDPDQTYNILVSGLPHNKATETNIALYDLVEPRKTGNFDAKLQEFLHQYGHRSYSRDIIFPTWREKPQLIIDIVDSLVENERDVQQIEAEKKAQREELTQNVLDEIETQQFGLVKKLVFRMILNYAQIYIGFRENQRFFLDHQDSRFRAVFLEMGNRLAQRGVLQHRDDVFFLFKEEVFTALQTGEVPLDLLTKRKADFHTYQHTLPPKFLQGNLEFDEDISYQKALIGVASSPGVVTGTARLIQSIEELHTIEKDEILVATCTDPGWTPIFIKIKGLVTETGGILSHGAVVSREYGIPAVTGVKNAMQYLRDGDIVTVNGNTGEVRVK